MRQITLLTIAILLSIHEIVSAQVTAPGKDTDQPSDAPSIATNDIDQGRNVAESGVIETEPGIYRVTGSGVAPTEIPSGEDAQLAAVYAAELDAFDKLARHISKQNGESYSESPHDTLIIQTLIVERSYALLDGVKILEINIMPDGSAKVIVEFAPKVDETNVRVTHDSHGRDAKKKK